MPEREYDELIEPVDAAAWATFRALHHTTPCATYGCGLQVVGYRIVRTGSMPAQARYYVCEVHKRGRTPDGPALAPRPSDHAATLDAARALLRQRGRTVLSPRIAETLQAMENTANRLAEESERLADGQASAGAARAYPSAYHRGAAAAHGRCARELHTLIAMIETEGTWE